MSDDILLIIESCKENKNQLLIKDKISSIKSWDNFINLSYAHGVFPLVYHTLKEYKDILSEEIYLKLKFINMDIVKQNMLMTSELLKVMKLLEENDIEAISFKGPVLSQMAYGDITLRQYVDLDILIKQIDTKKVFKLLKKLNYISILSVDLLDKKICSKIITDFNLKNTINGIELEFHWKLIEKIFGMDLKYNEIKDYTIGVIVNNYKIKTFSLEHQIVYLSMHGSKHGWERLEWLIDIDRLIRNNIKIIDWEKVIEYSKLSKSEKSLFTTIYLLKELFKLEFGNLNINKIFTDEIKELYDLSMYIIFESSKNKNSFKRKKELETYRFKMITKSQLRWLYSIESFFTLSKLDCEYTPKFVTFKFFLYFIRVFRLLRNLF